jgi:hypothetical protein
MSGEGVERTGKERKGERKDSDPDSRYSERVERGNGTLFLLLSRRDFLFFISKSLLPPTEQLYRRVNGTSIVYETEKTLFCGNNGRRGRERRKEVLCSFERTLAFADSLFPIDVSLIPLKSCDLLPFFPTLSAEWISSPFLSLNEGGFRWK